MYIKTLTKSHSIPGIIGFIGQKGRPHSNQSDIYLTLSPLSIFDQKYSEAGRVLSSMSVLENCDPTNLEFVEILPLFSYKKKQEYKKMKLLEDRFQFFKNVVNISGQKQLDDFVFEFEDAKQNFLTGAKEIHLTNINNNEQLKPDIWPNKIFPCNRHTRWGAIIG